MLLQCCKKVLLNEMLLENEYIHLNETDRLTLLIFLIKKGLKIGKNQLNKTLIKNHKKFNFMLTKLKFQNKFNIFSLKESIFNKTFRNCFGKWIQNNKKIQFGNVKHHTKFFKFLFKDFDKDPKLDNNQYQDLYKKSQIDRKKTKKIEKMKKRKPKFMNLVLRKKEILLCIELKKKSKLFFDSFHEIKTMIFDEFSDLKTKSRSEINSYQPFPLKLRLLPNLISCISKIRDYQNSSNFILDSSNIKRDLKYLKCPFTFKEIQSAFINM